MHLQPPAAPSNKTVAIAVSVTLILTALVVCSRAALDVVPVHHLCSAGANYRYLPASSHDKCFNCQGDTYVNIRLLFLTSRVTYAQRGVLSSKGALPAADEAGETTVAGRRSTGAGGFGLRARAAIEGVPLEFLTASEKSLATQRTPSGRAAPASARASLGKLACIGLEGSLMSTCGFIVVADVAADGGLPQWSNNPLRGVMVTTRAAPAPLGVPVGAGGTVRGFPAPAPVAAEPHLQVSRRQPRPSLDEEWGSDSEADATVSGGSSEEQQQQHQKGRIPSSESDPSAPGAAAVVVPLASQLLDLDTDFMPLSGHGTGGPHASSAAAHVLASRDSEQRAQATVTTARRPAHTAAAARRSVAPSQPVTQTIQLPGALRQSLVRLESFGRPSLQAQVQAHASANGRTVASRSRMTLPSN